MQGCWAHTGGRRTCPEKKRIFSTKATAPEKVGTVPGAHTNPRSTSSGSSCVTQRPARSPWTIWRVTKNKEQKINRQD